MDPIVDQINALVPAKKLSIALDTPDEPLITKDHVDFSFGEPSAALFPLDLLRDAANSITETDLQYCTFRGHSTLLSSLSAHLSVKNLTEIQTANLLITNGAMDALGLLGLTLLEKGDIVLVEDPTYFRALRIFRSFGANILGIRLNDTGMDIEHLKQTLEKLCKREKKIKMLYLIPTHQNPSGNTLPVEQRNEIIELSNKYNFLIVEDDVYSELTYDGSPPPSLYQLSFGAGNVIQVGTVSKILSPGLKIGWIIAHPQLTSYLVNFKIDGGTNPVASAITAAALARMDYNQRIIQLRKYYKHRRDIIIEELSRECVPFMDWTKPTGGFYVWAKLKKEILTTKFASNCAQEKVNVLSGSFFATAKNQHTQNFRLAFCSLSPQQIITGVKRLHIAASKSWLG